MATERVSSCITGRRTRSLGGRRWPTVFLTDQSCAFHRNVEISSRYAWIYRLLPACFKWAGMAAIASHHVRLALFPLRLDTDRTGYVDIPHSLGRRKSLLIDGREHDPGDEQRHLRRHLLGPPRLRHRRRRDRRLRALLRADAHYAPVLAGFEAIDQGRRVLEDETASADARRTADRSDLGGQRPAPRARAARPRATELRSPLVRLRQARLDRLGHELRGARSTAGGCVLHLVLPLLAHRGSRTPCGRKRGRGSPASTTAGAGS